MDWSGFDKGVFLVNCLGIVYNPKTKRVLIGKRENDPHIKQLSWSFPGGRPNYGEELEEALKREILAKTHVNVLVKQIVYAKTYPEKHEFLSVYFYCETTDEASPGSAFSQVKWVAPSEVAKYFTTSFHPKVREFLEML